MTAHEYEFDEAQNRVLAQLGAAMAFVGVAMLTSGTLLLAAVLLFGLSPLGRGIFGVLAILLIVAGLLQYGGARHFRRIVRTHASDIRHLMIALGELRTVYVIQRWLWIVLATVLLIALASTRTGYSLAHGTMW